MIEKIKQNTTMELVLSIMFIIMAFTVAETQLQSMFYTTGSIILTATHSIKMEIRKIKQEKDN